MKMTPRMIALRQTNMSLFLLQEVEREEEADPDDVDEMPVGTHGLDCDVMLAGELPCHATAEHDRDTDTPPRT